MSELSTDVVMFSQVTAERAHPSVPRGHHDQVFGVRPRVHQHQHHVQAQEDRTHHREASQVQRVWNDLQVRALKKADPPPSKKNQQAD